MIREAQTSLKIVRLNRKTGTIDELVSLAVEFRIVGAGFYKGGIVARLRKYAFNGEFLAPVYWYYLLNSDGLELGFIGREESDLKRFFEKLPN